VTSSGDVPVAVDPERTALLVVDVQNDFCTRTATSRASASTSAPARPLLNESGRSSPTPARSG
jgi:hypothetical protein